jgi:hypothetical protein
VVGQLVAVDKRLICLMLFKNNDDAGGLAVAGMAAGQRHL